MRRREQILRTAGFAAGSLRAEGKNGLAVRIETLAMRFFKRPTNSNCSQLMRLVKDASARLRGGR